MNFHNHGIDNPPEHIGLVRHQVRSAPSISHTSEQASNPELAVRLPRETVGTRTWAEE